ncbi:hypothetical protein GCM10022631_07150 [Deinococcus rubellus]
MAWVLHPDGRPAAADQRLLPEPQPGGAALHRAALVPLVKIFGRQGKPFRCSDTVYLPVAGRLNAKLLDQKARTFVKDAQNFGNLEGRVASSEEHSSVPGPV